MFSKRKAAIRVRLLQSLFLLDGLNEINWSLALKHDAGRGTKINRQALCNACLKHFIQEKLFLGQNLGNRGPGLLLAVGHAAIG